VDDTLHKRVQIMDVALDVSYVTHTWFILRADELILEGHRPAEFGSYPNQTHLLY